MKIGITAIAAGGLLVAAVIFFSGNSDREDLQVPSPVTSTSQAPSQLAEEHTSTEPENPGLPTQTVQTATAEPISYDQPLVDSADDFELDSIPEEIEMKVVDGSGSPVGKDESLDALQTLQDNFERDSKDGLHSFEAETRLLDMVSNSERLSDYALAETTCKLSNCKVTFFVADEEQHTQLTNDLLLTIQENQEDLNIMIDPVDSEGVASFYMGLSDGSSENPDLYK